MTIDTTNMCSHLRANNMTEAILYYLIAINFLTFVVYGIDKWKVKQGSWRIPEATLLGMAIIGGSIGALLGMKIWHHKTMHKKFKYGLPLILIAQIALVLLTSCKSSDTLQIFGAIDEIRCAVYELKTGKIKQKLQ